MTEGLPELIASWRERARLNATPPPGDSAPTKWAWKNVGIAQTQCADELEAALREASRPQEAVLPESLTASLALFRENPDAWHAEWQRKHDFKVRLLTENEALRVEASRLASPPATTLKPMKDRYVPEGGDRIIAVCRDGSWIEETPAGNRMHSSFPEPDDDMVAASPPASTDPDDWTVSDRDQRLGLTHLDQPRG